jgi:hypothetical protein
LIVEPRQFLELFSGDREQLVAAAFVAGGSTVKPRVSTTDPLSLFADEPQVATVSKPEQLVHPAAG